MSARDGEGSGSCSEECSSNGEGPHGEAVNGWTINVGGLTIHRWGAPKWIKAMEDDQGFNFVRPA